jgi:3-oxoacyl-[acyl-carrier-protein] synthase II
MRVVITGIGYRSALGNAIETWEGILANKSAIRSRQPFEDLPAVPLALIGDTPILPNDLLHQVLAEVVADGRLTLPAVDCGVAIASSRAHQVWWERFAASPGADLSNWLETLPHHLAIASSRYIGSRSAVIAPMAACATGLWTLAQGVELIRTGACEMAIAGSIEAAITPLSIAGFQQMGALARQGCYPFDRSRDGLVLGEGGAIFLLETLTSARQRGAKIYGEILGYGMTNDASGICAPDDRSLGAIHAVKKCLDDSGLSPADIDYIHAHGTGTQLNDRQESDTIEFIFPASVPVSSTKGATGHTLGASGALGAAICLQAIEYQTLPPSVGTIDPDFSIDIIQSPRQQRVDRTLCFSFGFGGQNAAMAIGRVTPN